MGLLMENNLLQIRVTAVLIENSKILLVKQAVSQDRNWSLPGGRVERGELLSEAIEREMKEETGLDIEIKRLLYVCDKPDAEPPLLHITFEVSRIAGSVTLPTNEYDANPIHDVRFVKIADLCDYGLSIRFKELAEANFPEAGSYQGLKEAIGLA